MSSALEREFPQASEDVKLAIRQFLFSQPLAVKCSNRLWISHSLPNDRFADMFDLGVFDRELTIDDCLKPGPAYLLTWGRRHSQVALNRMAERLDVDVFVLGHQPQQKGWRQAGDNLIILASDHNHGCLLQIDLAESYSVSELADALIPLASIA
jgi:hypothetical protein